jgi:hypothetical protein
MLMRHKLCTDTAILVLHKMVLPERGGYKLKVRWINTVNPLHHFDMGVNEVIYIREKEFNEDWHELQQVQSENKSDR